MSRTHDVTISAFDLDRIESELASVTEQRDRLAEAQNLLKQCLSAMPVGYIPTHTEENLPEMIGDLAKALAEETTERENLERELTEALSDLEFRRDLFKLQEQQLNDVRAERDRLAEALRSVKCELGVPQPEYPSPVANAYWIADEALQSLRRTAMSEGWIKLSDRQPELGTLCKWWVLSGQIDSRGKGHYTRVKTTINRQEVGANGFSCKGKGMMFSPPEHTYWKGGSDDN